MKIARIAAVAVAVAVSVACARIAIAQSPDRAATIAAVEQAVADAIARAEPSVVAVLRAPASNPSRDQSPSDDALDTLREAQRDPNAGSVVGAGVIIDPAGLVLTQYLAVREGDNHSITTIDRKTYPATIRAADPRSALAVLAIDRASLLQRAGESATVPANFPAIRFAPDSPLRKGQFVVAVGNPFAIAADGEPTSSWGTITNLAQKAPTGSNLNDAPGPYNDYRTTLFHLGSLIQTDAKLGWSTGGGALVNLRGELIGITTTVAAIAGHEQPAGYAIPLNATIRRVIDTLKQGREVEYGMLGIGFGPPLIVGELPNAENHSRLSVSQVYPGGPAAKAGLAAGDVLTRINDQTVEDIDAVQLAVSASPPGAKLKITYERAGHTATVNASLAKLSVAGKVIAAKRPDAWRGIRVDYASALDATALAQAISSEAYDDQGCVLVSEVETESDAWRAGVRPGMFISHIAGKRVTTPDEFRAATGNAGGLAEVEFTKPLVSDDKSAPSDGNG